MQVLGIALQGICGEGHPLVIIDVLCTTAGASRCGRFVVISINRSVASSGCGSVCIRRIHIGQPHPFSVDCVHLDTDRLTTVTLTMTLTLHAGAAV